MDGENVKNGEGSVETGTQENMEPAVTDNAAHNQELNNEIDKQNNQVNVQQENLVDEPKDELTEDEKIIDGWLKSGKTEVSTNDLIQAGFDAEIIEPYEYRIGRFLLKRMLLVSPYKIEIEKTI